MLNSNKVAPLSNERGSVLLLSLMLLVVLTIIGLAATSKTIVEQSISSNDRLYRGAFYAAESGLAWVAATPGLYGDLNLDPANPLNPPNEPALSAQNGYDVNVAYQGISVGGLSLRGSGFSAGKFRAHDYLVTSTGTGPGGATSVVSVMGFRIGF